MPTFEQSLDKFLTTPPENDDDGFFEMIVEELPEQFFEENELWIMDYNDQFCTWLHKLRSIYGNLSMRSWSNKEQVMATRKHVCDVIVRAHRMYIKPFEK